MKFDPPRALNPAELLMLDLVLSSDFAGADELREQGESALVVGGCDCGCPSVYLWARGGAGAASLDSRLVPCELEVRLADDEPPGQVVLFACPAEGAVQSGLNSTLWG